MEQSKKETKQVQRSRTFMLVRRTGDSRSAEGLNPGGIVRQGARVIGSRAGGIDLYLAPFAPARAETPGSGLPTLPDISSLFHPPLPAPQPSNGISGAGGPPAAPLPPRSPSDSSGFPTISGSNSESRAERERERKKAKKRTGRADGLGIY